MRSEKEMLELLDKYLNDARDILDSLDIEYGEVKEIKVNKRLTAIWAKCIEDYDKKYIIDVNPRILAENIPHNVILDTVVHELLHCHKDRMCHTGEWKRCAELINSKYKQFNIQKSASFEKFGIESVIHKRKEEKNKYRLECRDCHYVILYKRKPKDALCLSMGINFHKKCSVCGSTNLILLDIDEEI